MGGSDTTAGPDGENLEPLQPAAHGKARWALTFASLGIVFGDIGTSPLYALRQSLTTAGAHHESDVIGVVSLLIWALVLVVTVKYVLILLTADNRGEGGTLSLMALAQSVEAGRKPFVILCGTVAAGLFFGDAMITPAISVLSAVEGLELALPGVRDLVLPIAAGILIALFVLQARGSGRLAALFAPIMLVWFAVLTVMGAWHIPDAPVILKAFSPAEALSFLFGNGLLGFLTLGSVFLAVTGAEALYADLGHFGRVPIRRAWLLAVFPALVLNYLGQGALAIARPEAIGSLFFAAAPASAQLPLVILATIATVIASQAVISGTYSLAWQAMRLGLLPQLKVVHMSSRLAGRIYMPRINWLMLAGVLALLFAFRSSSALAGAYGIAVSGTMVVTTVLAIFVFIQVKSWTIVRALVLLVPLLVVDTAFVSANLFRIDNGGYVPLLVAVVVMAVIWAWRRGNRRLSERLINATVMLADLTASLKETPPTRVEGTAVFLTSRPELAPAALSQNLKHNHVLHKTNIIVSVRTAPRPWLDDDKRAIVAAMDADFTAVELNFGYFEPTDIVHGLQVARAAGLAVDPATASFFISRRTLKVGTESPFLALPDRVFVSLSRLSDDISDNFGVPADRAVEIGVQITL